MKTTRIIPLLIALLGCSVFCIGSSYAQISSQEELDAHILRQDSLLFTIGFNQCDISKFEALLSEDFEFYHDRMGPTLSKEDFINSVRKGLCGSGESEMQRTLIPESVRVYAMVDKGELYGALQTGQHHFGEGPAQFSHLWVLEEDGQWRIRRVLSFDH